MQSIRSVLLGCGCALLTMGCGGGGGGGGSAGGPSSAKDLAAFGFTQATNPSNLALTADVAAAISGTDIAVTVPYGTDLRRLVATFTTTGTRVHVAGVDQSSGVTANDYSGPVAFTVQAEDWSTQVYTVTVTRIDKAWGPFSALELSSQPAGYAAIDANEAGDAVAVWLQDDGTRHNVWGRAFSAATGAWGPAGLIESNPNTASAPAVAVGTEGDAFMAWTHDDGTRNNLWANRYDAQTGTLAGAESIEGTSETINEPAVRADASGNAFVFWEQDDGSDRDLVALRYAADLGWRETVPLIPEGWQEDSYAVGIDPAGNALVVVLATEEGATQGSVYAVRYSVADDQWSTPVPLESGNGAILDVHVAVGRAGDALAVWEQFSVGDHDAVSARYDAALDRWDAAVTLDVSVAGTLKYPAIACDDAGNAIATWNEARELWGRRYVARTGWQAPELIPVPASGRFSRADLAMDRFGNAFVFESQQIAWFTEWVSRSLVGGGWDAPSPFQPMSEGDAVVSGSAFDGSGNGFVLLLQSDGVARSLFVSRYE